MSVKQLNTLQPHYNRVVYSTNSIQLHDYLKGSANAR